LFAAHASADFRVSFGVSRAASDMERLAGDIRRRVGCQECDHCRDLFDLADAAERSHALDPVAHLAFVKTCRYHAFSDDHAGIDGVDVDFRRELLTARLVEKKRSSHLFLPTSEAGKQEPRHFCRGSAFDISLEQRGL
jgi:hypothetical protein